MHKFILTQSSWMSSHSEGEIAEIGFLCQGLSNRGGGMNSTLNTSATTAGPVQTCIITLLYECFIYL